MNTRIKITVASQSHIDFLKGKLREADNIECLAISGRDANDAIQDCFENSLYCWVGLCEGVPFNCFGVGMKSMLQYIGTPWLLGTDVMEDLKVGVAKLSRGYVAAMLEPFNLLENWVDARNVVSKRWLKWCGFTVEAPEPMGVNGEMFHRFWIEKRYDYV